MPELNPEQQARQHIDAMLADAGWVVQNYRRFDPGAGLGVALCEVPLASGTCDYLRGGPHCQDHKTQILS